MQVYEIDGSKKKEIGVPDAFSAEVKPELIRRAAIAENTMTLQPQGHYVLAGMQTTARYYGAMNSYRTGRHMGVAIRPREKLGGGRQGKVKRIPSAVKGKRAHPHMVEKTIIERMNKREYQAALLGAIAASAGASIIVDDKIEGIKKTKEMVKTLGYLNLGKELEEGRRKRLSSGLRRVSRARHYKKSLLLVVNKGGHAVSAARNIPGIDACTLEGITVSMLAPGGKAGRKVLWSESVIGNIMSVVSSMSLGTQAKYLKAR